MPHGTFIWNELLTRDIEGAKAFYARLAGWSYNGMQAPGGGTYWIAEVGGKPVAGLMDMPQDMPAEIPPHWFEYLEVDDVDARVTLATQQGGTVLRPASMCPMWADLVSSKTARELP